jgi:hypothetical protein
VPARLSPKADGREWLNKALPPTSHKITLRPLRCGGMLVIRRADVTDFGVPEHQGDGSLLPMLVRSGSLSL